MAARRRCLLVLALLAGRAAIAQAPTRLQVDGAVAGFRSDGEQLFAGRGRSVLVSLPPAGEYVLHFAPANGRKSASLPLLLREGDDVHVAVGRAADADPAAGKPLLADAFASAQLLPWTDVDGAAPDTWRRGDGVLRVRPASGALPTALVAGPAEPRDYLLRASVQLGTERGSIGLVARWTARDQHYRFVWDAAKDQLRLERQLGAQVLVLAAAPAPRRDGKPHVLALQVQGFRLQAFCDDAVVAQMFDGAHGTGRFGVWADGKGAGEFADFQALPPALPQAVLAVLRRGDRAQVVGRAPQFVGADYVLALRLDRPFGPLLGSDGAEVWLLLPPVAPTFLLGVAARDELVHMRGSFGPHGEFSAELHWPARPLLRGRVALVSGYAVSADGSEVLGVLPAATLVF